ncbi:MucR family transcriptional regulator [Sinorhizobium meliloti]|nr:MucR family transcriptional regulator [Sinorhizobium meliloti]MDW9912861.1 MucR family transcriptional regulator [Sinorhizobium meliloti]MDW9943963.1 MucR family transcriptional regulator [Sinorhizobium meliloti]
MYRHEEGQRIALKTARSAGKTGDSGILIEAAAKIVASYVSFNHVGASELPAMILRVFETVRRLAEPAAVRAAALTPAVPIRGSVTADYIICLEDGKKFKSLKRHLREYGLTPEQYRAKWNLPSDYPMVAPNYTAARSALAKQIGLGRKRKAAKSARERGISTAG